MTKRSQSGRYLLLRVSRSRGSARPVRIFATLQEAVAAAAELMPQPSVPWLRGPEEGVWQQLDWTGRGFLVHRMDDDSHP